MPKSLCLVAVGDISSGKTKLLIKYTFVGFEEFTPITFVNNFQDIVVDHIPYSVFFMDTEPADDYASLRKVAYEKADCVLICYSVKDRKSFDNVSKKWCIEIRKHVPKVPIILVATEIECRDHNSEEEIVTTAEGENLKYLTGAAALIECSVKHCSGIDDVFIEAVRSTYERLYKM